MQYNAILDRGITGPVHKYFKCIRFSHYLSHAVQQYSIVIIKVKDGTAAVWQYDMITKFTKICLMYSFISMNIYEKRTDMQYSKKKIFSKKIACTLT